MKDDSKLVRCECCGEEYIPCCFCGEGPNGPSHGSDWTHGYQEHAHQCEDPNAVEGLHAMDRAGWL